MICQGSDFSLISRFVKPKISTSARNRCTTVLLNGRGALTDTEHTNAFVETDIQEMAKFALLSETMILS